MPVKDRAQIHAAFEEHRKLNPPQISKSLSSDPVAVCGAIEYSVFANNKVTNAIE
jgi:hypothetical protein